MRNDTAMNAEGVTRSNVIEISRAEYYHLKCDELELRMLEAGGVDNWTWYGESLNPDGEKSFDDLCDAIWSEIFD